jgi:hypothetical protein
MRRSIVLALFSAIAVSGLSASAAWAADKPVKSIKEWKGSVADANLAKDAPHFIADAKQFEKLWTDWKLGDKVPTIDFTKEIAVISTTPGSRLNLSCSLTDKGDLKLLGIATSDFGEGFRYMIVTVSREGVKSVEGKELPK